MKIKKTSLRNKIIKKIKSINANNYCVEDLRELNNTIQENFFRFKNIDKIKILFESKEYKLMILTMHEFANHYLTS